jgi:transposase
MGELWTFKELNEHLEEYFDIKYLESSISDELETLDFNLPFEDYNEIIEKYRQCDSEEETEKKSTKRRSSLKRPVRPRKRNK